MFPDDVLGYSRTTLYGQLFRTVSLLYGAAGYRVQLKLQCAVCVHRPMSWPPSLDRSRCNTTGGSNYRSFRRAPNDPHMLVHWVAVQMGLPLSAGHARPCSLYF